MIPELVIPDRLEVAEPVVRQLPNGMKIYVLPSDDFEVLRVSFVFRAGSTRQPRPFVASATANMLCEGTARLSAREIAEQLDFYGSYFDVNLDRDYAYISFCSLTKFVAPTLDVAAEILLHPAFPAEEVAIYRAKRRQRLAVERAKVDVQAREAFARSLFGAAHPYGISHPEAAYDDLDRSQLEAFYRSCYTARNGFVVCSGRVGEAELAAIEAVAAQFPTGGEAPAARFPAVETTPRCFVPHAGAVQSSIRMGRLLFTREHPDFLGMQLLATVLGGYFGSRLMQNLREERGYTYGVMAAMVNFEREGYLAIATQVGTAVTADALVQIRTEIERLRREPVPEEELSLAKRIMIGEMMRVLDGPFGIADVTIENLLCGRPNAEIDRNVQRIQAFTPADMQQLAVRWLAPEEFVTVVAGDPQLAGEPAIAGA